MKLRRTTTWLFFALFTVTTLGTACNGGEDSDEETGAAADTSLEEADAAADSGDSDTGTRDAGEGDVEPADASDAGDEDISVMCPNPVNCDADERLVDCRCVSVMDRRCTKDSECRDTESCEEVDGHQVCIFEPPPVKTCPGSAGCDGGGNSALFAGAASRIITPEGFEQPTPQGLDGSYMNFTPSSSLEGKWQDCGLDGLCPGDEGYEKPDKGEADGKMQGMWIAGFGAGRPAQHCPPERVGCEGVDCCVSKFAHDHLKVQVAVLRHEATTVAFASVDTVGWFNTDIEEIRRRLDENLGVDLLVMAATHNHEAPDTAGQWGPGKDLPERTGRSDRFIEKIYRETVAGVEEAIRTAEPANAYSTVLDVGTEGLAIDDSRPPYIFNDDVPVVQLTSKNSGDTIATLLSFGNHPEVLWGGNPYITADYPHYVRKYIEEGLPAVTDEQGAEVKPKLGGLGGVTVMFAGSLGGLINPGDGGAKNYADEVPEEDHSFEAADAVGQRLASHVLGAVHDGQMNKLDEPDLRFAHKQFLTPIENKKFQLAAFQLGVLERDVYNATRLGFGRFAPDLPELLTEVSVVRFGEVTFFTAPGEVFPETLVGGFPGKKRVRTPVIGDVNEFHTKATCDEQGLPTENDDGTHPCIVTADQENPPDWSKAPDGPYVYEKIPGKYPFFIGLGGDFLGYMVPSYDFEEDGYLSQAPGSHYEETNGVGPKLITQWKTHLDACLSAVELP